MSRSQEKLGEKWGKLKEKHFLNPLVTVKCEITFFLPPDLKYNLIYSTRQNEDGKKNMNAMRNEAAEQQEGCVYFTHFIFPVPPG